MGELVSMDVGSPSALAGTLAALLDRGVPPERALRPFTSNVARLLRLHRKGRIAPGRDADLVVLDENNRIRDVMASGVWHVREGEQLIFGRFERDRALA
jgi:beta-aspartyl-dipeptidase (metallo-type)